MGITIHDIAREAGVSVRTVSRALNRSGYVAKATRAKIEAVMNRRDFYPSRIARNLRTGQSQEVCVICGSATNELVAEEIGAFERRLRECGYWISVLRTDGRDSILDDIAAELRARKPAALATVYGRNLKDFCKHFDVGNVAVPHVTIDLRDLASSYDGVVIDRTSGIYDAVRYLYNKGHRRVAYLGLPADPSRVLGYRRGIREFGLKEQFLPFEDAPVVEPGVPADRFTSGRKAAAGFLAAKPRPTAVQAYSDEVALGFIAGLHPHGIRIPGDLDLIGFDNRQVAAWCTPALTTVAQPARAIGEAAAQLLTERLENKDTSKKPRRITVKTKLVIRDSA